MAYVKKVRRDNAQYGIKAMALDADLDATILHKSELENDFTQTEAGVNALDAAAGKTLNDSLSDTIDNLSNYAFPIVPASYDIETIGNYKQIQASNESSNSFVTASGEHLYTLLSWTASDNNKAWQMAITTDGKVWTRAYIWWNNAWGNWSLLLPAHRKGETWSGRALCAGHVTSNGTEIHMYIPTRGVAASGFTVGSLVVTARFVAGGYALQNVNITSVVTSCRIFGDGLEIVATPTWTNAPVNNTPIAIDATFTITFT